MMLEIYEQAKLLQDELVAIRRKIHQNPEVGKYLPQTKAFVKERLRAYGYEPQDISKSSIVATIQGDLPGKTILLRSDMDALAIQEKTGLSFQSQIHAMHGCGHDMHTAMLLGAAKLFKQYSHLLHGQVKLLFQEDEEGFTGAKAVIQEGVLDHPHVDAALALHVNSGTPSHMVLCGLGHFMAGCTLFKIEVQGVGSHGAMPEKGVDPINIAAHIYLSLQEIIAREISPQDACVLTIGKFQAGTAPNIIPETVVLEGTIRYKKKEIGDMIFERIQTMASLCAESFRGKATVTAIASAPPLINNNEMIQEISDDLKQILKPQQVMILSQGGMGSEDFASFSYQVPTAYLLIGAGTVQENECYGQPMHNQSVVFNEDILSLGSAIFVISAINWLKRHHNHEQGELHGTI